MKDSIARTTALLSTCALLLTACGGSTKTGTNSAGNTSNNTTLTLQPQRVHLVLFPLVLPLPKLAT